MENHNLIHIISRLLSSSFGSCRLRALPDVAADSSISMQTTHDHNHNNIMIPFENDITINPEKTLADDGFSGPNYPCKKNDAANRSSSSHSHSGCFSTADDKFPEINEPFFSFSSCSGESFRLKSIHENGERRACSRASKKNIVMASSSRSMPQPPPPRTTSDDMTKTHENINKKKKNREVLRGSDDQFIMSAKIYYSRRKATSSRRSTRRSLGGVSMVGEYCVAVEKKSRDPRGDFEASMVDMIMAKEMLGAEDLERLLICFLSLNSVCYHPLIFQVFSHICQSFFTF